MSFWVSIKLLINFFFLDYKILVKYEKIGFLKFNYIKFFFGRILFLAEFLLKTSAIKN